MAPNSKCRRECNHALESWDKSSSNLKVVLLLGLWALTSPPLTGSNSNAKKMLIRTAAEDMMLRRAVDRSAGQHACGSDASWFLGWGRLRRRRRRRMAARRAGRRKARTSETPHGRLDGRGRTTLAPEIFWAMNST